MGSGKMTNRSWSLLCFFLKLLGLLGMILSGIFTVLGAGLHQDQCNFCPRRLVLIVAGCVNTTVNILPIILGFLASRSKTKMFGIVFICFCMVVIPGIGGLIYVTQAFGDGLKEVGRMIAGVYYYMLIFIYIAEIIISGICMNHINFTCFSKNSDSNEHDEDNQTHIGEELDVTS